MCRELLFNVTKLTRRFEEKKETLNLPPRTNNINGPIMSSPLTKISCITRDSQGSWIFLKQSKTTVNRGRERSKTGEKLLSVSITALMCALSKSIYTQHFVYVWCTCVCLHVLRRHCCPWSKRSLRNLNIDQYKLK